MSDSAVIWLVWAAIATADLFVVADFVRTMRWGKKSDG